MSTSKHVGVFATSGTVQSESYIIEINKFHPEVRVTQEACPLWVPLIENNQFNNEGGKFFVKHHVDHLLSEDDKIDTIILGCTHYPILKSMIEDCLPSSINVLSQGEIVADSLVDYLQRHPEMNEKCSRNGTTQYFTTENPTIFSDRATLFLGHEINAEKITLVS